MLIKLHIDYQHQPPVTVRVPDMGLTLHEWALAVHQATNAPGADRYAAAGAAEVDRALQAGNHSRYWRRGTGPGDAIEILGQRVRWRAVDGEGAASLPRFTDPAPAAGLPLGPAMHVSVDTPPPDAVAYVEDERDRLWTGRGHGEWRCLTDPAGRTASGQWATVWREYGPLTPLVPVDRLDEPVGAELAAGPHSAGRPVELPAF